MRTVAGVDTVGQAPRFTFAANRTAASKTDAHARAASALIVEPAPTRGFYSAPCAIIKPRELFGPIVIRSRTTRT
jgi:hypothetical protein